MEGAAKVAGYHQNLVSRASNNIHKSIIILDYEPPNCRDCA
jgi:hypothetical protein